MWGFAGDGGGEGETLDGKDEVVVVKARNGSKGEGRGGSIFVGQIIIIMIKPAECLPLYLHVLYNHACMYF